ncbi:MAG: 16S rRNA processing protein RimM [Tannerellaceae bacterium]|jgi:16S rRNA processing protein RimM|nr:16S rRNA processing protein RimM [Tannerellaceae bacterium]
MISKEKIRKIGAFTRPHGISGEIGFVGNNLPEPGVNNFIVCEMNGIYVPYFIEGVRSKTHAVQLVRLAAVGSGDAARRLSGKEVFRPTEAAEAVDDASWAAFCGYLMEDETGRALGEIIDIDNSTINLLFVVDTGGRMLLVPAVEEWIMAVDNDGRRLRLKIPDGLLDIG